MLELTATQAAERIRSGELDAAEYFDFYRQRAAADAFNSYIWVADETPEQDTDTPFAGVPVAVKDLFCTEGIPSQAGSKILEDYRPPYTATLGAQPQGRRRHAAGQDQPGRVRDGLLHRELGLRPDAEPVGPDPRPGRLERRLGGVGRRGHGAVVDRHGHRRLDPPARRAVRDRRDEAHLRRDQPLRDDRLRVLARPGRPVHARRHGLRAAAVRDGRRRPVRQHEHRPAGADRAPDRDRPEGHPARRPRGALGRGHRSPACWRSSRRRWTSPANWARRSRRCGSRTRRTASPPTT